MGTTRYLITVAITAALAATACCISISDAETWESDGLVYEVWDDGTAAVTGYTGDPVAISVPEYVMIDGITYPVTSIGDYAFEECFSLVTVELPDSIISIGSHAFDDTSIAEFRVPSGVTDTLVRVPQALEGELRIPDGVVACDVDALNWCSRLTSLVIPDSMETMNFGSLCSQLRYVYIGASVGPFETSHLATSRSLETIEVSPENDVYTSVDGVLYSKDMTVLHVVPSKYDSSVFEIPDTVTVVDELAVNNCTMIGTLIVPASVTSMGLWAVYLPNMHTLVMEGTVPEEPWYWLEYEDSDRFDVYTDSPELFAELADIGVATVHPLDEYVPEGDGGDVWILAVAVVIAMIVMGIVCGRRE